MRVRPAPTTTDSGLPGLSVVAARLLVPAWLLVLAGLQIADGTTDALPIWLAGMAVRLDLESATMLRILLGAELLFAGIMLLIGRWARPLAVLAMSFACFSAIASISAAPDSRGGVALGAVVLAVSVLLLLLIARGEKRTNAPLSLQWQIIGALAVGVIAAIVAVQMPIRTVDESIRGRFRPRHPPQAVDLDFANLVGKPLTESPIKTHLPLLVAATLEGTSYVVFYNPRCGSCHDLFKDHFATPAAGQPLPRVIAVLVPPDPDATLLPSDQPEQVDCPSCEFMELKSGPIWIIQPPVVVVVKDGIVTCVGKACLATLDAAPPAPPTSPPTGRGSSAAPG